PAPAMNDKGEYEPTTSARMIRVYTGIDVRLMFARTQVAMGAMLPNEAVAAMAATQTESK
ncbi:MAG TPA: hypothetical protein VHO72_15585, partial [Bacteroidales bacterium]|nr:hypothetical protein [Bacteroidales bacterium]